MKILKNYFLLLPFLSVLFFTSCDNDDDQITLNEVGYRGGVIVLNEGAFNNTNASVSFIDSENNLENDIFNNLNSFNLGDVAQSITYVGNNAYLVVNNSAKIEVVNAETFERISTIEDLPSPRFLKAVNSTKAYVSNYYSTEITILDLTNNVKTGAINFPIATGENGLRDQIETVGDEAFVVDQDSIGLIILNTTDDSVSGFMPLAVTPRNLVKDANDKLWVFAFDYDENFFIINPRVYQIDAASRSILNTIEINESVGYNSYNLIINNSGNKLYLLTDHIYEISTNNPTSYNLKFEIPAGIFPYGFNIDEENNLLYISDAIDFASQSDVHQFDLSDGSQTTFKAGIASSKFYIRP